MRRLPSLRRRLSAPRKTSRSVQRALQRASSANCSGRFLSAGLSSLMSRSARLACVVSSPGLSWRSRLRAQADAQLEDRFHHRRNSQRSSPSLDDAQRLRQWTDFSPFCEEMPHGQPQHAQVDGDPPPHRGRRRSSRLPADLHSTLRAPFVGPFAGCDVSFRSRTSTGVFVACSVLLKSTDHGVSVSDVEIAASFDQQLPVHPGTRSVRHLLEQHSPFAARRTAPPTRRSTA